MRKTEIFFLTFRCFFTSIGGDFSLSFNRELFSLIQVCFLGLAAVSEVWSTYTYFSNYIQQGLPSPKCWIFFCWCSVSETWCQFSAFCSHNINVHIYATKHVHLSKEVITNLIVLQATKGQQNWACTHSL